MCALPVQKESSEGYSVGPYLLALFVFVVCGSGEINHNLLYLELWFINKDV